MKDENIKEINIPENVLVALGDLTNGALNYYKATETVKVKHNIILDYITNLQEELDISQTNEETYRLEMLDITKILGLDEHTTFDEVKEYATNLQEENERLKGDNEFLKKELIKLERKYLKDDLLNILQGSDE